MPDARAAPRRPRSAARGAAAGAGALGGARQAHRVAAYSLHPPCPTSSSPRIARRSATSSSTVPRSATRSTRTSCSPSAPRCAPPPTTPPCAASCCAATGRSFSAGMDVAALAGAATRAREAAHVPPRVPGRLEPRRGDDQAGRRQIHGVCLGGALELALACDLRVLSEDAFVGLPETRLGLVPDLGGSSRLPQVVGVGRAKELIMTGRVIGAADAERSGSRTASRRRRRRRDRTSWSTSCWPARRSRSGWRSG